MPPTKSLIPDGRKNRYSPFIEKPFIKQLNLSEEQRDTIETLYETGTPFLCHFDESQPSQDAAQNLLSQHGLTGRSLLTKWAKRWSKSSPNFERVLYQCKCGSSSISRGTAKRRTPYPFVGCLAHLEVRSSRQTSTITQIAGHVNHNAACNEAQVTRFPEIPVHPHVYEDLASLLEYGADLTGLQVRNTEMIRSRAYRDMDKNDPKLNQYHYRYELLPDDYSTVYRKYYRSIGLDPKKPAEQNIDAWLDPNSPTYHREFAAAVASYTARSATSDRMELVFCTDEMVENSWKYGHGKQIVMDGTFGVCSSKILLFIVLGINERGEGEPLAFIVFSAPSDNKHTAAGYDSSILQKLLRNWKARVERRSDGREFLPKTAITDTDHKERFALSTVFKGILLRLCRFHLKQCLKNKMNQLLPPKAKSPETSRLRKKMKAL
ncbi:hypothetical protein JCM5350_003857, partial [Sporobolomyces pararoseus]